MLKVGVAKLATTKRALPIALVLQKNGSLHFCFDYCRLNVVTVCENCHISEMDEYNDCLGESRIFLTLNAVSGYRKIDMY